MLRNALTASGLSLPSLQLQTPFEDRERISGYAREAVQALHDNGLMQGKGNGRFAPGDQATRAESAVLIYRVLNIPLS